MQGPLSCLFFCLMLAFMLCVFSLWWSTRVFGCRNAATCTPFHFMKHLVWKPGNIQVLYYVNKINRSYSIVFIAYTKNEMEKMWSYFLVVLYFHFVHKNHHAFQLLKEVLCLWSIKYSYIYSDLLCCNMEITKLI